MRLNIGQKVYNPQRVAIPANYETDDALLKPGGIRVWEDNEIHSRGKAVKQPDWEDEGPTVLAEHLRTAIIRHI